MMRQWRVLIPTLLVAGGLLLGNAVPSAAQGLTEVLVRVLSTNCAGLGGAGTVRGPLFDLCTIPGTGTAAGGGAFSAGETLLGESDEQRREQRRLAERRQGRGARRARARVAATEVLVNHAFPLPSLKQ